MPFALLAFLEILTGGLTFIWTDSVWPSMALAVMYGAFFVSVILLYLYAPETGCGCGLAGSENTTLSAVLQSGLFLVAAAYQVRRGDTPVLINFLPYHKKGAME